MGEARFEIVSHDHDVYEVTAASTVDGCKSFTLSLSGADASTAGRLGDDQATARATVRFLLEYLDAGDLPDPVELDEVLAAYSDATEQISALRN